MEMPNQAHNENKFIVEFVDYYLTIESKWCVCVYFIKCDLWILQSRRKMNRFLFQFAHSLIPFSDDHPTRNYYIRCCRMLLRNVYQMELKQKKKETRWKFPVKWTVEMKSIIQKAAVMWTAMETKNDEKKKYKKQSSWTANKTNTKDKECVIF